MAKRLRALNKKRKKDLQMANKRGENPYYCKVAAARSREAKLRKAYRA